MNKNKQIKEYIHKQELDMETIIKDFSNYILKIIRTSNYHFHDEDIEEMASDVFLVVWNHQDKLDRNKLLAPYIAGVTKNIMLKKQRDNKNMVENIEEFENFLSDGDLLEFQYENLEKNHIITNELEKMKLEDKNIFVYYYYNAKGIKEIAGILNITEMKVKSRLFRIRKKLKLELERKGYSYERK